MRTDSVEIECQKTARSCIFLVIRVEHFELSLKIQLADISSLYHSESIFNVTSLTFGQKSPVFKLVSLRKDPRFYHFFAVGGNVAI